MPTSASIAPPASPAPAEATTVACAACGGLNPLDSRFCRLCGTTLTVLAAPQANGESAAATAQTAPAEPANPAREASEEVSEIDRRRAEQLLERAARLAERGDMPAAILASRQAVALAHSAAAYSLLGSFLERSNDGAGAMAAYEKVLQIAPTSILERDALARLREASARDQSGSAFHFNPDDLFSDAPPPEAATQTPVAVQPPAPNLAPQTPSETDAARPSSALLETSDLNPTGVGSITQAPVSDATPADLASHNATQAARQGMSEAPGTTASPDEPARASASSVGSTIVPTAAPSGIAAAAPAAISSAPVARVPVARAPVATASAVVPAPLNFDGAQPGVRRPVEVRSLFRYPSYYFRGVPLMATVGSGLLFMLWAAAWSTQRNASRSATALPVQTGQTRTVAQPNQDDGGDTNQTDVVNESIGGRPNLPASADPFAAPGTQPNVSAPPAPGAATRNTTGGTASSGGQTAPRVSVRPVGRTAARPATARVGAPATSAQSAPVPAAPVVPAIRPAPVVAPPIVDSGAASTGGRPVNPGGTSSRDSIRVQRPRSAAAAPVRPAAQSRAAERAASSDANAGRSNQAIDTLNNQIQNSGADDADLAYRYQQRATLFLTNGDNARAADDFQMAIAAYQGQIGRGENVDSARSGITACRSGLRIAYARLNR